MFPPSNRRAGLSMFVCGEDGFVSLKVGVSGCVLKPFSGEMFFFKERF